MSNDPAFTSDFPRITASGSSVYATWQNSTATSRTDILFRASNDNGSSFGPVLNLSKSLANGVSDNQEIAATGSYVYLVWQDNATGNIWFTVSSNNGQSFGSLVNLSTNSGSKTGTSPQIAVAGSNVYIIWQNDVSGNCSPAPSCTDIWFSASTNNGGTFVVSKFNLSSDGHAILPVIAAVGNNVYAAWRDSSGLASCGNHDLCLRTSSNSGSLFGSVQNISKNPTTGTNSLYPELVATGTNVYAVWTRDLQSGPDDTMFATSTNSGTSFTSPVQLTSNGNCVNPEVAAAGNDVYAVWEDHSILAVSTISFVSSSNNGATFGSTITLSSSTGVSNQPQVAAIGTNVYAAWQDQSANGNVYQMSSSDSAVSFGSAVNISQDTNSQRGITPSLAANGNKVAIAWQDDSGQTNPDILFRTNAKPNFVLMARQQGWNSTSSTPCSPSGPANCNPTLTRFKNKLFVVQIVGQDSSQHDIAIYANGTAPGSVNLADNCSLIHTVGCLAKSQSVTSGTTSLLTFTPAVPATNFTGVGGYEYYDQNNPATTHGHINIYKSPDLDGDGKVTILDMSVMAFAYGSTAGPPPSSTWNIAADLDNNGKVNILDVALGAFYFDRSP